MNHASRTNSSVVSMEIATADHRDFGVAVVISRRPVMLLVPSHVASAILLDEALCVRVNGDDLGLPSKVQSPLVEKGELTVLRFNARARITARPLSIPKTAPILSVSDEAALLSPGGDGTLAHLGQITGLRLVEGLEWITSNIQVSSGQSGSPLLVDGRLAAICQGMVPCDNSQVGTAQLTRLDTPTLRELAGLAASRPRRRWSYTVVAIAVALALGLVGWMSWQQRSLVPPSSTASVRGIRSVSSGALVTAGLDGRVEDEWDAPLLVSRDPTGDASESSTDLITLFVRTDDTHLHIRLDLAGAPDPSVRYSVNLHAADSSQGYSVHSGSGDMVGSAGVVSAIDYAVEDVVEFAIPFSLLRDHGLTDIYISADSRAFEARWEDRYDDIPRVSLRVE